MKKVNGTRKEAKNPRAGVMLCASNNLKQERKMTILLNTWVKERENLGTR